MITAQKLEEMRKCLAECSKELSQIVKDLGGCDHSVGICECHLIRLAEEAAKLAKTF
jgi:hypothetical protein